MPDARPTADAPDDDPYLWLEEIEGAKALAWVEAETRRTLARFGDRRMEADRDALKAIYDRPDNIPIVARRGGVLFNFWKDAKNPRGLWRTTSPESFRASQPDWRVLLDLDELARKEGEDWIWQGASTLPVSHDRAILRLSRGGGDAVVLREFDLGERRFVADGFALPEAKSGVAWLDRDTLLLSSAIGAGMATESGYARTVRLWRRGEDPLAAPAIFEVERSSMSAWGDIDRDSPEKRLWFADRPDFLSTVVWIGNRGGPKQKLDRPSDSWIEWHRDWLALRTRTPWTVGGHSYGPDTVLGIGFKDYLAGRRAFAVLFEPGSRRAIQNFFWTGGTLVLSILDDLKPVYELYTPGAGGWSKRILPGMPETGTANAWPLDIEPSESNGDMLATIQDPLTPPTLSLFPEGKAPEILKRAPPAFDPSGLVVRRHEAVSIDGTRIPYTEVGPERMSGDAPVHLYGYGGYQISLLPNYNPSIGKLWLERGGTSVVGNLRGGGEFGTSWHEAARREKRWLAHEDFAAVAADLVKRGVTRPDRIAAEGGSNGGLLIANMLTRHPEKFGALFCTIPVIDMRRYTKLLAGASWMAEWGDPDKPEDWAYLQRISAYHQAAPGKRYPPILIATSRRDDRVHPGHARKMAAKLQALGAEAWFYEPGAGGHGYGKDNAERAQFVALGYRFLRSAIGWD